MDFSGGWAAPPLSFFLPIFWLYRYCILMYLGTFPCSHLDFGFYDPDNGASCAVPSLGIKVGFSTGLVLVLVHGLLISSLVHLKLTCMHVDYLLVMVVLNVLSNSSYRLTVVNCFQAVV